MMETIVIKLIMLKFWRKNKKNQKNRIKKNKKKKKWSY